MAKSLPIDYSCNPHLITLPDGVSEENLVQCIEDVMRDNDKNKVFPKYPEIIQKVQEVLLPGAEPGFLFESMDSTTTPHGFFHVMINTTRDRLNAEWRAANPKVSVGVETGNCIIGGHRYQVDPGTYISTLKSQIEQRTGVPPERQILRCDWQSHNQDHNTAMTSGSVQDYISFDRAESNWSVSLQILPEGGASQTDSNSCCVLC